MTDDYIEKNIQEEIKDNGGNLSKTSRQLGISLEYLQSKYAGRTTQFAAYKPEQTPENIKTLGKSGMDRFVIAVKRRGRDWPSEYSAVISDARKKWDAGTHVLCTGHTRGFAVLYLVPRRRAVKPCTYFSSMGAITPDE